MPRHYGFIPPELPEESILSMYGVEAPPEEQFPELQFQGGSILEHLSGLEGMDLPRPTSFGEGFAYGLSGSLGRQGSKAARARETFDASQSKRRAEFDERRRQATEKYREGRRTTLTGIGERQRTEAAERKKYELDNLKPTPAQLRDAPWLARMADAEGRVPQSYLKEAFQPKEPKAPKDEPLVQVEGPDGRPVYVRRSQAEGKSPPLAGAKGAKPGVTERAALIDDESAIAQQANIEDLFEPGMVGPVRGRFAGTAERGFVPGVKVSPKEANFRAAVAQYRNATIKAISGANVSKQEEGRMLQAVPNTEDPSDVFAAKLAQTRANLERIAETRRRVYEGSGIDLSGIPAPARSVPKKRWTPGTTQSRQGVPGPTKADADYVDSLGLDR